MRHRFWNNPDHKRMVCYRPQRRTLHHLEQRGLLPPTWLM